MTKTLILMQGIPGSGKSTVARAICRPSSFGGGWILSTDEYWYREDPFVYNYDTSKAAEAHRWNQDRCRDHMNLGNSPIIIDNTNVTKERAAPYIEMATEYGYQVQVVRVTVPIHVAIGRNDQRSEDRKIPEEVILKMASEMEELL